MGLPCNGGSSSLHTGDCLALAVNYTRWMGEKDRAIDSNELIFNRNWNTNITNIIQAACGYNWCLGDCDLLPYGETLMMELERPPFYISFVSEPTPFPFLVSPPFRPLPHWAPHCSHLPAAQSWLPPPWSDGMGGAPSLPINCTLAMDPRPHSNEIFFLGILTFIENIFASLAHGSQFELSISYTSDTIRKKCLHACLYPKPESRQQLLEELIIPCHQMLYIKIPPLPL